MIDWWALIANIIWITAAALALAVASIAYYESQVGNETFKSLLGDMKYRLPLNIAGGVFCVGLAASSDQWWEIGLWFVLAGLFGVQVWMIDQRRRRKIEGGENGREGDREERE